MKAIKLVLSLSVTCLALTVGVVAQVSADQNQQAVLVLRSQALTADASRHDRSLRLDEIFFETANGRTTLPSGLAQVIGDRKWSSETKLADGRLVRIAISPKEGNFELRVEAQPAVDIIRWGLSIDCRSDEYFTGLMERVVDGPQTASWAPGIAQALNLRGQKIEMLVKPTTSIYAPFFLSSRGYAVFVKGTWPGRFDFAVNDPARVGIQFEGPVLEMKIYTAPDPLTLVRRHALDAGPPFLPPPWMYTPWRWRDEHAQRSKYYDGTSVTGPFNSEVMEDVLMMRAYGIPNGVYWIDRPWGPGLPWGYDDFEIDQKRLPNFSIMVRWLEGLKAKTLLWIAPFFQGQMEKEALAKGYALPGQKRPANGNNYPMVDLTNPAAKAFWQNGVAKLLKLGVAAFKLDRGEEDIPDNGPYKLFDRRTLRENRNAYVAMYVKATYDVASKYRDHDFVLMPRGAYTGSSPYGVFWGGDIGGTQEGLRASIIAVQRSAVMGYPNWGSDTCGYNQQLLEQEVCGRWLGFSALTPIMEVGPTRNVAFWNLPRAPSYDQTLIAIWRLYARLHQRLIDYNYKYAQIASRTGIPIVRPLFLIDPKSPAAWTNWWTYQYGDDLVVSPIWEKNKRSQEVYLPRGSRWRFAWDSRKVFAGGQTVKVSAELHQIPLFIRVGSKLNLGDLNQEWKDSQAIAAKKPDLKTLDAQVRAWFEKQ